MQRLHSPLGIIFIFVTFSSCHNSRSVQSSTNSGTAIVISPKDSSKISLDDFDKTFTKVEEPAEFPGGNEGWRKYLEANLKYPKKAERKNTQGTVRVQMTVLTNGKVINIKTLSEPGDGLGEEAERVIRTGPDWTPAKQNGKMVIYRFVQNITFQLQ